MNIRIQLIRAGAALVVICGLAAAESLMTPAATDADCPYAKAQRIMLLDPIQKHPIWIDAQRDPSDDADTQHTVDSKHDDSSHGVVTS
jgi:hypothetical protein